MGQEPIRIEAVGTQGLADIKEVSLGNRSRKDLSYWELSAMRMESNELTAFVAYHEETNKPVGYGFLNWKPKYRVYDQQNIPEIQDLNVLSEFRRQGIAKKLIRACEDLAREKGRSDVGISFGLTRDYGYAQRLYISLGYIPDGFGVTYDREPVPHGQLRAVDDDLCLMLVKSL